VLEAREDGLGQQAVQGAALAIAAAHGDKLTHSDRVVA
jgi:hypothetical protein